MKVGINKGWYIVVLTSCVNWYQLISIDVNWHLLTSCWRSSTWRHASFFIMVDVNWCQLTTIDLTRQTWCFLTPMTFFDVFWRLLAIFKNSKISKIFWRKLTKIDASVNLKPRQLTSIDVNWYQLTSIIVSQSHLTSTNNNWRQMTSDLMFFDAFWCFLMYIDDIR